MKIKKFMLPIWWYNRGSFPLGNKYLGVFVLNGLPATCTTGCLPAQESTTILLVIILAPYMFANLLEFWLGVWNYQRGLKHISQTVQNRKKSIRQTSKPHKSEQRKKNSFKMIGLACGNNRSHSLVQSLEWLIMAIVEDWNHNGPCSKVGEELGAFSQVTCSI